ncbi:uncharacterized protein LOC120165375 [Hibiscus syriacus]|uniref:uncharacterized protein LOC120165375 n=1 Tax=Hibiscus syriacus TaxID=106335 RepID=UPI0019235ECB|nr:uncharacterized protein LOC120165375 [Hibiscus syriacus]
MQNTFEPLESSISSTPSLSTYIGDPYSGDTPFLGNQGMMGVGVEIWELVELMFKWGQKGDITRDFTVCTSTVTTSWMLNANFFSDRQWRILSCPSVMKGRVVVDTRVQSR